jgi:signal transduction histidine kinase/ActR/RegA family two-component response regulator
MSAVIPDSLAVLPLSVPPLSVMAGSSAFQRATVSNRLAALESPAEPNDPQWRLAFADLLWRRGDTLVAIEHAEAALAQARASGATYTLQDALRLLVKLRIHCGEIIEAESAVAQLDGVSYGNREPHALGRYAEAKGWLLLRTGDLSNGMFYEAESRFRAAFRAAQTIGDVPAQLRIIDGLASSLAATGQYPAAIEQLDLGLELCSVEEAWQYMPQLLQARAFALRDLGFHPSADLHFSQTLAWAQAIGDVLVQMRSLMGYAVLKGYSVSRAMPEGLGEVEEMLGQAMDLAVRSASHPVATEIYFWYAGLYEKLDMQERAEAVMEEARAAAPYGHDEEGMRLFVTRRIERRELDSRREKRFRNRTRETIESIPDALFIVDPVRSSDGTIVDLMNEFRNSAADRLAGCQSSDVRTLSQLRELETFGRLEEPIRRAIEQRENYSDEIKLFGPNETWISRRVVPVGEGAAVTMRDVTLHHVAEAALRAAAEQARQADRAKSEFLANMSHEVRTPINGVLGLARLLADTDLDEKQKKYVEGISASADILLSVLGDVLDLSKIEAGRVDMRPEPTNLGRLVGDVVSLFQGQASQRGITLEARLDEDLPHWVSVDGPRLRQVLANLVGNAVKFTAEGHVRIRVKKVCEGARLEVSDTGPGVPADDVTRIFQAFRQGSTGVMQGGTGLGLTISRRIVELMGGQIGVSSQEGAGSLFWVELPLSEVDAPVTSISEAPAFAKGRVLLVEDNAVNVLVAVGLLDNAGCEVDVVGDGAESIEKALSGDYRAVFMDVRMPGMDGLEATRRIRRRERPGVRIPIIALTASALTDDQMECFDAGMDDYLGKPFTPESLYAVLGRWMTEA